MRYGMRKEFPSLTALVEHVRGLPSGRYGNADETEWAGGTYEDAYRLATHGWTAGVTEAMAMASKIAERVTEKTLEVEDLTYSYDVAGSAYDPGAYDLGVPECWGTVKPHAEKRGVRIGIDLSVSGIYRPHQLIKRGAVLAGLVMALRNRGVPVEVDALDIGVDRDGGINYVRARIVDAAIGSQLDVDRLVYALGHPSMVRRLMCAATNGHRGHSTNTTWGTSRPATHQMPEDNYDLYIHGLCYGGAPWDVDAVAWALARYHEATEEK